MNLTQERLKELLHYDPDTGVFIWKVKIADKIIIGDVAGYKRGGGYVLIGIYGIKYLAHRLVWLYAHGGFPPEQIDHINQIKDDNRIVNLRAVSRTENLRNRKLPSNNTSGFIGVGWVKQSKRWCARITVKNKLIQLGSYTDISDAISARKAANIKYGYHPNHGKPRQDNYS